MENKRCALYLRVSTDRQAQVKEGSLDTQEQRLRAYIDSKDASEKWIVKEVYREEGKSGKDMNRPEFQRMMKDIADGYVDVVLCTKLDRITRRVRDFDDMTKVFEKHNVDFVSIGDSFDTSTATGRAILKITLVFGELEREQVGERVTLVNIHKSSQGLRVGGQPPLGYNLHQTEKGVLVKNDEEAKLVKLIFDMYEQEGSIGKVARLLNKKGYRTKTHTTRGKKQMGGKLFSSDTVHRMLTNPAYIGKVSYKGAVSDSTHERIISDEQFYQTDEMLKGNKRIQGNSKKVGYYNYLLLDLAKCVNCESSMTGTHGTKKDGTRYFYYRCTNKNKRGKEACDQKDLNARVLETFVIEQIKKLDKDKKRLEKIMKESKSNKKDKIGKLLSEKSSLNNRKREIESETDTFLKNLPKEALDADIIRSKINDLDKSMKAVLVELESVSEKIESIQYSELDKVVVKNSIEEFSKYFDRLDEESKKDALKLLIKSVLVSEKHITIIFYGSQGKLRVSKPKNVNRLKSEFGQYLGKLPGPDSS